MWSSGQPRETGRLRACPPVAPTFDPSYPWANPVCCGAPQKGPHRFPSWPEPGERFQPPPVAQVLLAEVLGGASGRRNDASNPPPQPEWRSSDGPSGPRAFSVRAREPDFCGEPTVVLPCGRTGVTVGQSFTVSVFWEEWLTDFQGPLSRLPCSAVFRVCARRCSPCRRPLCEAVIALEARGQCAVRRGGLAECESEHAGASQSRCVRPGAGIGGHPGVRVAEVVAPGAAPAFVRVSMTRCRTSSR